MSLEVCELLSGYAVADPVTCYVCPVLIKSEEAARVFIELAGRHVLVAPDEPVVMQIELFLERMERESPELLETREVGHLTNLFMASAEGEAVGIPFGDEKLLADAASACSRTPRARQSRASGRSVVQPLAKEWR